ncbi:MAG TPA: condensation domain-containing protein, partial [Ktedonobacteraceae bacterium]|nr:condensation domain-containing protein [Ktedonobacteraceae bacterium]
MVLEQDNNVLKRTTVELLRFLRDSDVKVWLDGERLRCNAPQGVLTPRLRTEISEKKAELIALLQKGADAMSSVLEPILPVPRDRNLPQSFAQQRLWFLDQLFPQSQAYYTSFCIGMKGPLQVGVLEQCLNEMIRRHESLRTTFYVEDHEPLQVIHASANVRLPFIDLSWLASAGLEMQNRALFEQLAQQPYNLAQGPLLRLAMVKLHSNDYRLFLAMHHIIDDGWSMSILVQEMLKLYTALVEGRSSPLAELPLQYADFACWQRQTLQGDRLSRLLTYWRTQLAGAAPLLPLPTDHPRPARQSYAGAMITFSLSPALTAHLKALSQREGVTIFMTLLAAFQVLLARYSGCEDILVGTPIANRTHKELEGIIGFFVNTLVLRTDLSGNPRVRQVLQRVRDVALQAYAHQDLPFERLVEELQPERNLSYSPLFQVLFDFRNMRQTKLFLPGMHLWHVDMDIQKSTAFDLECDIEDDGENLSGSILYNTGLFEASTIKRMIEHFQILLKGFVEKQDQHLWDLPMRSPSERKKILAGWRSTQTTTLLPDSGFFQYFERQVAATPEAIAVACNDECLTYEAL